MSASIGSAIATWEDEGGFAGANYPYGEGMSGTTNQVEWAERIWRQVREEFDRVSTSFWSIAKHQTGSRRSDTLTILAILEDKRAQVLSRQEAGYFIRDWWEPGDRVRQLIFDDPRYQVIKNSRGRRPRREVDSAPELE